MPVLFAGIFIPELGSMFAGSGTVLRGAVLARASVTAPPNLGPLRIFPYLSTYALLTPGTDPERFRVSNCTSAARQGAVDQL